ncbi:MAG TPA: hypothetical protein VLD58_00875, partial [Gemmatimonadales bacterium]|nr:hypothetical protein [Gemmatimonadales bacterium]
LVSAPIVPIESLAPGPMPMPLPVPVPIAVEESVAVVAAVQAEFDGWDLAASYGYFERLVAGPAVAEPEPVAAPAVVAPVAPAPAPIPTPVMAPPAPAPVAAPAPAPAPVAAEPMVVEISELCYRGRSALERADVVRREIQTALSASTSPAAIQPLVNELLDLVELALVD